MKKILMLLTILGLSFANVAYAKSNASSCSKSKHCASSTKHCCSKKGKCAKKKSSSNIPASTEDLTK